MSHAGHHDHAHHGGHAGAPEPHAHDRHAGHSVAMFRDKFWLTLALTVPILVWGHMLPRLFGYAPPHFPGSEWIAPVLGTVVFFYGGLPFVQGAVRELRDRLPGMMTLIALAISVAFVFSAAVTLGFPGTPLWEELATLVSVMLLGHWLEMRSISQAQGALGELAKLLPDTAAACVEKISRKCRSPSSARATSCSCGPAPASRPTASCARAKAASTRPSSPVSQRR